MYQTLITVLRYSITYYQKDLFICTHYANKHKATALHKAYWLPCLTLYSSISVLVPNKSVVKWNRLGKGWGPLHFLHTPLHTVCRETAD